MKCAVFVGLFLVLVGGVSCQTDLRDIVETARSLNLFSFVIALEEAGLTEAIKSAKDITVFIPTNQAFAKLPESQRNEWRNNLTTYQNALKYHVVYGNVSSATIKDEDTHRTLFEPRLARLNIYNHTIAPKLFVTYMGSVINTVDLQASNGVIHLIDDFVTIVQPATDTLLDVIKNTATFSVMANLTTYVPGFVQATLANTTHAFTFLAPSDELLNKFAPATVDGFRTSNDTLRAFLEDYVLPVGTYFSNGLFEGEKVPTYEYATRNVKWNTTVIFHKTPMVHFNDKSTVLQANIPAVNGVIHSLQTALDN